MKIVSIQKVYSLSGATAQMRIKFFNKLVFKFMFKPILKPV